MIGNYRDIFVAIITIIALVLPLLTYLTGANTVKATASSESQTRSTISAVLPWYKMEVHKIILRLINPSLRKHPSL